MQRVSVSGLPRAIVSGLYLPLRCGRSVVPTRHGLRCLHPIGEALRASATKTSVPKTIPAEQYGADQIQVLQGLDPVRKRPGMYIGSTGQRGLHHLLYEVLDNAIDEVQGGHASVVTVDIDLKSGYVTITDDGRGIPTDIHPVTGKSSLETVLTVLHAGGKFGGDASGYKVSGGLHGVGISVVNALSSDLEVTVWRNGRQFMQRFSRGDPVTDLEDMPQPADSQNRRGTQVRFRYDDKVFAKGVEFDGDVIRTRVRELAFLNSAATIHFRAAAQTPARSSKSSNGSSSNGASKDAGAAANGAEGTPVHPAIQGTGWETFHYEGGLREFVLWMNQSRDAMHEPIYFNVSRDGVAVEGALQWCSNAFADTIQGFANNIATVDGGTHVEGLRSSLTRTLNAVARKSKLLKEGDPNLLGEHLREGLGAVLAVKVPDPEFEGQTKTRLGNPEVRKIVDTCVAEAVGEWMERHPAALSAVVNKALTAARAADAARQARDLVRRKNAMTRSTLPGKLADCTGTNRANTEIFLVEGDSAGGSAKQARDRTFQAILPLRGKILNIERERDSVNVYKNTQLSNLIIALGLKTRAASSTSSSSSAARSASSAGLDLRYGRIIILTDADVDGAHIRTLLLTFLFRYQPELFEGGHVFAAVPPLFKLEVPRQPPRYLYSDSQLKEALRDLEATHGAAAAAAALIQRFKGLGEMMPEQLWQTTMNPATRLLRRLTIADVKAANDLFVVLMGDNVGPRRALITEFGPDFYSS